MLSNEGHKVGACRIFTQNLPQMLASISSALSLHWNGALIMQRIVGFMKRTQSIKGALSGCDQPHRDTLLLQHLQPFIPCILAFNEEDMHKTERRRRTLKTFGMKIVVIILQIFGPNL
jgi:hypothetical protein